jgi:hypothetical protein
MAVKVTRYATCECGVWTKQLIETLPDDLPLP